MPMLIAISLSFSLYPSESRSLPSDLEESDSPLLVGHGELLGIGRDGDGRNSSQRRVGRGPVAIHGACREVDYIMLAIALSPPEERTYQFSAHPSSTDSPSQRIVHPGQMPDD